MEGLSSGRAVSTLLEIHFQRRDQFPSLHNYLLGVVLTSLFGDTLSSDNAIIGKWSTDPALLQHPHQAQVAGLEPWAAADSAESGLNSSPNSRNVKRGWDVWEE